MTTQCHTRSRFTHKPHPRALCAAVLCGAIVSAVYAEAQNPTDTLLASRKAATEQGDTNRVIRLNHHLAYHNPRAPQYPMALAQAYLLAGQWAQALTQAEHVLTLTTNDTSALMIAAEAAKELAQWAASEAYYDRLMTLSPESELSSVRRRYAAMLQASGQEAAAEQMVTPKDPP